MSITIKQAFQKLAMVTGAAVKNPWFVGRNLNQAFAEIADNVDASGGNNYSSTEHIVGKWVDGNTDVYELTFSGKTPINKGNTKIGTISNFGICISFSGAYSNGGADVWNPLPDFTGPNSQIVPVIYSNGDIYLSIDGTNRTDRDYNLTIRYTHTAL